MRRGMLVCSALLIAAACGTPFAEEPATTSGQSTTAVVTTTLPETTKTTIDDVFEFAGTVVDSDDRGPRACAGIVLSSIPPICGGIPLANFEWEAVSWSETAAGVTWASVSLTGRFDGEHLTLTGPPMPVPANHRYYIPPHDFTPPCETPDGGWADLRPQYVDAAAAREYASSQPDYGEHWLFRPVESVDEVVMVFTFTGDLAPHTAALEGLYDGAMCVGPALRSSAELEAIKDELAPLLWSNEAVERGIIVGYPGLAVGGLMSVYTDGIRSTVNVAVVAVFDESEAQAWLDSLFGEGVVVLSTVLKRPSP